MRYKRWAGPAVLLLLCATAQAADDVWMTDFDAARKRAEELQRPMLIHFGADWCGPCRQMERNVLHTARVKEQISSSVVAVVVNVDKQPKLAARFGVTSLPTDLFIEPDGKRLMQSTGYRPASEYASSVARASTRYHDLLASRRPEEPKTPIAAVPQNDEEAPKAKVTSESRTEPVLDGFCPVALLKQRRWIKGSPQFTTEHRGQIYHLSSDEALESFDEDPERFAPRFLGCDPIIVWQTDRAVPGSTRFGAFYDDELYLFVSDENRKTFKENPDRYIRTRVVLDVDQIESVIR
ncbi:Thioredoxin [Maioricimonas rarisocia]|uniref:Thioredoxin n=1 Tax=Maioricimonas rarisocia TaxID=2528026 RepID=A0A517Z3J3_9PLAN|nr:thioredoxin family protein [Maioricimonas rarisocia]QDU37043.1 Thioredoxin [Maioricimonas rarisocia]